MKISLRAYGFLSENLKSKGWIEIVLEESSSINDLIEKYGMDKNQVMTVLINSNYATFDSMPNNGDSVEILPLISGG